ncbi:P27 family phage terminase small subunit [Lacticaseibacillus saniviri]
MSAGNFLKLFRKFFSQRPPGQKSKRFFEIWEPVGGLDFRNKGLFFIVKGGGHMSLSGIKNELMTKINPESEIEVEKVDRYVSLVKLYQKLQKEANKNPVIVVKNGAQEYVKTNPALNDMNKISTSLIALGKDMGLASAPPLPDNDNAGGDLT